MTYLPPLIYKLKGSVVIVVLDLSVQHQFQFWRMCDEQLGYADPKPTLEKLAITMFTTYADKTISGGMPSGLRKDLTKKLKAGTNFVPIYVLEYLLGQCCNSDDPEIIVKPGEMIYLIS